MCMKTIVFLFLNFFIYDFHLSDNLHNFFLDWVKTKECFTMEMVGELKASTSKIDMTLVLLETFIAILELGFFFSLFFAYVVEVS